MTGQTISSSQTWTLAGSPYVVTGQVTVAGSSNPRLTIEPGVEVQFSSGGSLVVGSNAQPGTLLAQGSAASPVVFTSSAASKARGDWTNLRFQGPASSGPSVLQNATVEFAGRFSRSAVEVASGHRATLDNVTVREAAWAGVYAQGSTPTLRSVTVANVSQWGVYAEADARPQLLGVAVTGAGNAPLRTRLDQDLSGVTLSGNAVARVELHGQEVTTDLALALPLDAVTGERPVANLLGNVFVRNGATWTLPAGQRVLAQPWVDVTIGTFAQRGSLRAEGTSDAPVSFASADPAQGWQGLYFRGDSAPTGASVLRNATVSGSRDDGLEAYRYSGLALDNVTLASSARYGLRLDASAPALRNVDVRGAGWEGAYWSSAAPTWDGGGVHGSARSGIYVSGCGVGTLRGVVVEDAQGYGVFTDNACAGVHLDGVRLSNLSGSPWRNRLDATYDVVVENATGTRVEYWGVTLTASRTLAPHADVADGATLTPVLLTALDVRGGATWTLPAGTTLVMADWSSINLGTFGQQGSLRAEGTAEAPVSISAASATGWHGLYFRGDSAPVGASVLRNVTVSGSRDDGIEAYHYPGLTVDNVTLADHARWGIRIDTGSHVLRGVHVARTGWEGASWSGASPTWIDSLVEETGRSAMYASGCGVATLANVTLRAPQGYGFYADNACAGAHLDGVRMEDVRDRPWRNRLDARDAVLVDGAGIDEVEYWGVTLRADRTLPLHADGDAAFASVLLSTTDVQGGATLTLPAGTRLLMDPWSAIHVGTFAQQGSLRAEGTAEAPISIAARAGHADPGWYGLYFRGDSAPLGASVLRNVTVAHSRDDAIETYHYAGLALDNATLEDSGRSGLWLSSSSIGLRNVRVLGAGGDGAVFVSSSPTWRGGAVERATWSGVATSGCGMATLQDVLVSRALAYGHHSDNACNGAHYDGVAFVDVGRPWRNRVDARLDATVDGARVGEVEYWGATLTSNLTLPLHVDQASGATLPLALLSNVDVRGGATLTLLPGARLRVNDFVAVNVGTFAQAGSLVAEGTEDAPIEIVGRSGVPGWYGIHFRGDSAPASRTVLRNATLALSRDHGVDAYFYRGFELDNVTVERNAGHGVYLYGAAPGPALVKGGALRQNGDDGVYVEHGALRLEAVNVSRNGANGVEARYGATVALAGGVLFENDRSGYNATAGAPVLDARRAHFWRNGGFGVDLGSAGASTLVDNAFIGNLAGQARASGLHTWSVAPTPGPNVANGPFLGGNAWSDDASTDADGDGLGDQPYARGLGLGVDAHPVVGDLVADFAIEAAGTRLFAFQDATARGLAPPSAWRWDFGDGATSTEAGPAHEYLADGVFPVTLTVWNDRGQSASVTKSVVADATLPLSMADVSGAAGLLDWFVGEVTVTLSAADETAGVQAILWRLDGGEFQEYVAPIVVDADGEHVVDHFAVDARGNVAPVANASFRVDLTPPALAAPVANGTRGEGGWFVSDVEVLLAAGDATSGLASLTWADGAEPNATVDGPLLVTSDGVHEILYRATDAAGNVAEATLVVRRDATPPEVSGHESGLVDGAGWYAGEVEVNLTADDPASGVAVLNASVDGGEWFEVTGPFTVEGPGVHTVNVTATDAAGNRIDLPARTVRVGGGTPAGAASVDLVVTRDGWYALEPRVEALDAAEAPAARGRLPALLARFLEALQLPLGARVQGGDAPMAPA